MKLLRYHLACALMTMCAPSLRAQLIETPGDSIYWRADAGDKASWLSHRLATMELQGAGEPPLAIPASRDSVYRMVALGGWGGARVLRLHRAPEGWRLVKKGTTPVTGWQEPARRLLEADSTAVTDGQVAPLLRLVQGSGEWQRPNQSCRMGLDGWTLLLEARVGSRYVGIRCWVPEKNGAPAIVATMEAFEVLARSAFSSRETRAP